MREKIYRIHIKQGDFELDLEGDRSFVESYVDAFLGEDEDEHEHLHEVAPPARQAKPAKPSKKEPKRAKRKGRGGERKVAPEVDKAALKAFMKGRAAASNKSRYLEYIRFWHAHGVNQVGDVHIQACFEADGRPVPPTGRQNFGTLRKEGLAKPGTKRGMWVLTPAGLQDAEGAAKEKPARGRKGKPGRKSAKKATSRKATRKPRRSAAAKKRGRKPAPPQSKPKAKKATAKKFPRKEASKPKPEAKNAPVPEPSEAAKAE